MAYSTKTLVKARLLIDEAEIKYDDLIDAAIAWADSVIDLKLKPHEDDLPLDYPEQIIKEISADLAAGYVKRRVMPQDMSTEWYVIGIEKLKEYIQATYFKGEFEVHY